MEAGNFLTLHDKDSLIGFLCSIIHRSPGRIRYLEERLKSDLGNMELFKGVSNGYFRHYALDVFLQLAQSDTITSRLRRFKFFNINIGKEGFDLLTSDRPLIVSDGLHHRDAFIGLPIGPRRILFLAEKESVAARFAGPTARQLSRAVNDAIVRQAEALVISANTRQTNFIDNRLGVTDAPLAGPYQEPIGLVRWQF
jgi:hypothetical protein